MEECSPPSTLIASSATNHGPVTPLNPQLMSCLDGLIAEEGERQWQPPEEEGSSRVLGSANQLFLKIRASLTRCVKLVSKGPTLLGLLGTFKKVGGGMGE